MRSVRLAVFVSCAALAGADSYTLTKMTVNGRETIYSTYQQGSNYRTQVQTEGRESVTLNIANENRVLEIDPQSKKYMELSYSPSFLVTLAQWIARRPRASAFSQQSGKIVNVYFETSTAANGKSFSDKRQSTSSSANGVLPSRALAKQVPKWMAMDGSFRTMLIRLVQPKAGLSLAS